MPPPAGNQTKKTKKAGLRKFDTPGAFPGSFEGPGTQTKGGGVLSHPPARDI